MGVLKIKALKDIRDNGLIVVHKGREALMAKDVADRHIANGYAEVIDEPKPFKFADQPKKTNNKSKDDK